VASSKLLRKNVLSKVLSGIDIAQEIGLKGKDKYGSIKRGE